VVQPKGSGFSAGPDNSTPSREHRLQLPQQFERREKPPVQRVGITSALHPAFNRVLSMTAAAGCRRLQATAVLAGPVMFCSNRAAILVPSGLPRPAQAFQPGPAS
jgi:hypothetical protein